MLTVMMVSDRFLIKTVCKMLQTKRFKATENIKRINYRKTLTCNCLQFEKKLFEFGQLVTIIGEK